MSQSSRPLRAALACGASALLSGGGCGPGETPSALEQDPVITGEVETCRGESLDLSPDGRWIVVTCRDFSARVIAVDAEDPDKMTPVATLAGAGSGEGIRFHPSGAFAAFSTYRRGACAQGHANAQCQAPFGSEVVLVGFPQDRGDAAPKVIDRWPLAKGEQTCLGGEDVAFSDDGRRLAVICNLPSRLFVYDVDPASAAFGSALTVVDLPSEGGRSGWLDEVALSPKGDRAYVSELDGEHPKEGVIRVVEVDKGQALPSLKAPHMLVGLRLAPGGGALLATAWEIGAARLSLTEPDPEKALTLLRYDGGGFSYDLATDGDPSGQYGYAVTQYPARVDVYDFLGKRRGGLALPDVRSRQPTAAAARGDRSRVYVLHEIGKVLALDPKLSPPAGRIAAFALDAPCQGEASLRWAVEGATEIKVNGAPKEATGSQVVMSGVTRRHTLTATFPGGAEVIRTAAQWRPGAKGYPELCGQPVSAETPTSTVK